MLFRSNKLKPFFSFTNKRQIWRLLFSGKGRLIIEERDLEKKQAFFNCIEPASKTEIFKDYQLEEKFWVGIETVNKEIIFFHRYHKPDMPYHVGIIAFDIDKQEILWERNDLNFEFVSNTIIYASIVSFDNKKYFALNSDSGEVIEEFSDPKQMKQIKNQIKNEQNYDDYIIPGLEQKLDHNYQEMFNSITKGKRIIGNLENAVFGNYLLCAFHVAVDTNSLEQHFFIIDINRKKTIFAEKIGKLLKTFRTETFFIKSGIIFLIKNKNELLLFDLN